MQRKDGLVARIDVRLRKGVPEDEAVASALTDVRRGRGAGSSAQTLRILIMEEQERLRKRTK